MTPEEAFGATLRQLRREAQLSQQALALEADLDRTYISLLERGLRQPTLRTIITLSRLLHISPGELITITTNKIDHKETSPGL